MLKAPQHWYSHMDHLYTKAVTLHMAVICAVPGHIKKVFLKLLL